MSVGVPSAAARRATITVGMTVTLAALAMTFAALLLAYGIVRVQAPAWPPPGEPPLPALWAWRLGATVTAIAGSAALWGATGGRFTTVSGLAGAGLAGTAFLALQVGGLRALARAGVLPSSGIVASVVYALTLFHALHALVALVFLLPSLLAAVRGRVVDQGHLGALASFWHLVTAVWLVIFVAVFVT
jgi:heme/copper-type cytochrome/quinol oxidase subunit 3